MNIFTTETLTWKAGRRAIGLIFSVAAIVALAVPAWSAQPKPFAKVNDEVLTAFDFNEALNKLLPAASFHGGITPSTREKYRDKAMQRMIDDELLYQEAMKIGLKADKRAVKDEREAIIERSGGKAQYKQALEAVGFSDKEFQKKLEKRLLLKKVIEVEVDEKATVSDEEAREYYDKNKKSYLRPESWHIRHILISVPPNALQSQWDAARKKAEEALKKIKDGEDMASVAWDYSDDPYRVKGGDLGIVHSGMLVAELENAVKKLDVGEMTGVVQSIYGFHIARVEEKLGAEQLPYEDVADSIKKSIEKKRKAKLEKELIERLRADATIEVYDENGDN